MGTFGHHNCSEVFMSSYHPKALFSNSHERTWSDMVPRTYNSNHRASREMTDYGVYFVQKAGSQ
eukprot:scaffold164962_cov13-Prasinocladus_malaysianus.AAC.1